MSTKNRGRIQRLMNNPLVYLRGFILRFPFLSDELRIKIMWKRWMNYSLNLKTPTTFNEKLQWMKLNDRNPLYTTLVDKYAVKDYVKNIIGDQYIIPTLAIWDTVDDVDFSILPNQFVLKTTHDSGGVCICHDKETFDFDAAKEKLNRSLHYDYYKLAAEWPYKNVPRRIIAEKYLEDNRYHELRDYKFFCFSGKVKALFIATERQHREEPYFDFFDRDFNHLDIVQGHPQAPTPPEKPINYELMIELAEILSKDMAQVRVDFYEVNGKVYFGELTFFHHSGIVPFEPRKWDDIFGDWFQLPQL